MKGLSAMLWKELREIQSELMRGRNRMQSLSGVLAGAMLGLMAGAQGHAAPVWAIPFLAAISTVMVVVDAFTGERERHTLETLLASHLTESTILLGKYLAVLIYAVAMAAVGLVGMVVTVRLTTHGAAQLPSALEVAAVLGESVLAAGPVGAFGLVISIRAKTVRSTQQAMAYGLMIPMVGLIVGWHHLSPELQAGVVGFFAVLGARGTAALAVVGVLGLTGVLLALARARFKRELLILD